MAAWARLRTSFSSLPTVTSPSSSSSSSESLAPLDLVDQLWFYSCVLPLPSLSLPCLPHFSPRSPSPPPDTSTLIAQCMFDGDSAPFLLHSSSSSPRLPSPNSEQPEFAAWYFPVPHDGADRKENGYPTYIERAYCGYSSLSDSDEDESYYRGYPRLNAGDDEEAFHYYTAPSDWDEEETYTGYPALSDCEGEQPPHVMNEDLPTYIEPEDALSGIYDVAALLKGQHHEEVEEAKEKHLTVPPLRFPKEAVSQVSAWPHFQVSTGDDQADMKESLKLWAHAVALTLPWKAAAQARPLL